MKSDLTMRLTATMLSYVLLLPAQQPAQQGNIPNTGLKISVTTNLVVVNVDVKDKSGKPIENLKASDFVLSEDDKAQKIAVFEYQRLESEVLPEVKEPPKILQRREEVKAPDPIVVKKAITPSAPGQIRFKDRRLLVFFFDMSSMPQEDQLRAQKSALDFLAKQVTPADMVSIMTFSNKLNVIEDFTGDREKLISTIKAFKIGEGSEFSVEGATGDDTTGEDNGDAFTADESEFNVFNTDRKLSALESAAKMLGSLPEKKALVYFSSGISKSGMDNESQLRATINAAIRSNVAFYPVDARGLVASAPAGNASTGSQRGSGTYSGSSQRGMRDKFNSQQETLVTLAGDTGGKALLDNNDLTMGIQQAQKDISSYYILGYYSTNAALDGKYRKITVKISGQPQARLDFRKGYFAGKEFKKFNDSDKERQLEEALMLGDPMTDLPLAMEVNYFRMGKLSYFVPVAIKIPGSALELAKKGKNDQAQIDFIAQVRDSKGRMQGNVRDYITVKLNDEASKSLGKRNLEYDSGFSLPPGDYTIKFLARENVTGKMGTFETKFNVPDVAAETPYLRTSSIVWANQREPLTAAVGAAERNRKLLERHPLVQDNHKLVPSITHVYRKDQNLYVYVEVYDPAFAPGTKSPSIQASLSFFQGKSKAFQTESLHVDKMASNRQQQAVPVEFKIPLSSLKPGKYTCQVNLVDEVGQKFAFSRAPMMLLP